MQRRWGVSGAVALVMVVALSACVPGEPTPTPTPGASTPTPSATPASTPTPTPSSTPTPTVAPPESQALVLSEDGLGPLRIGMAAIDSSMLVSSTTDCGVEGGEVYTGWTSALPFTSTNALETESEVFSAGVTADGEVYGVTARDSSITTPLGVSIGSTLDEVLALPGITEVASGGVWRRFVLPGDPGNLVFDVGDNPDPTYWGWWQGRVTYVSVLSADVSVPRPNMHGMFPRPCL